MQPPNLYNQNDDFVEVDLSFINGFLTSLALLRDYSTREVGFNFYFKRLQDGRPKAALASELKKSFSGFRNRDGKPYKSDEQVNSLLLNDFHLDQLESWETTLAAELDFWLGATVTEAIMHERRSWGDRVDIFSQELVELLRAFFSSTLPSWRAYTCKGDIQKELTYHWGGLKWLDIVFSDEKNNFLLHFDLSD